MPISPSDLETVLGLAPAGQPIKIATVPTADGPEAFLTIQRSGAAENIQWGVWSREPASGTRTWRGALVSMPSPLQAALLQSAEQTVSKICASVREGQRTDGQSEQELVSAPPLWARVISRLQMRQEQDVTPLSVKERIVAGREALYDQVAEVAWDAEVWMKAVVRHGATVVSGAVRRRIDLATSGLRPALSQAHQWRDRKKEHTSSIEQSQGGVLARMKSRIEQRHEDQSSVRTRLSRLECQRLGVPAAEASLVQDDLGNWSLQWSELQDVGHSSWMPRLEGEPALQTMQSAKRQLTFRDLEALGPGVQRAIGVLAASSRLPETQVRSLSRPGATIRR